MVGTYHLKTHFPGQWFNITATNSNTFYKESYSPELALIVQEDPIPYYSPAPLPTEYWTRPINQQLREWTAISGNWLVPTPILPTDNLYAADNDAPETAHILWTTPVGDTIGGLAGGIDSTGYGIGDAYEGKWGGVVIGGILFYNKYDAGQPQQTVVAVDLRTGQELWSRSLANNGTFYGTGRIAFGQVLRFSSMNYQGDFSYLWVTSGTNWYAFEPFTGDWKYNMTNVPSGTNYYGPKGEILKYAISTSAGWLAQWNTTSVVVKGNAGMGIAWGSQVRGKTFNASLTNAYDWNVTIPKGLPGSVRTVYPQDRLVGASINATNVVIWAINLNASKGQIGTLLYNTAWTAPSSWAEGNQTINWAGASLTDNVAVLNSKECMNYYAFDLTNGQFLWGPSPADSYLNMFDRISTINYGRLVSSGAAGDIRCYNARTGELIWNYTAEDPDTEFTIGNNWWMQQILVSDGKVYLGHVEHSPNQPLPRGAPFLCIDIMTGEVIWKMDGGFRQTCWGGKAVIGDSIIAFMDTYDQRMYAVGKGPSQTTVTAPATGITLGNSLMITGSVMDISPGTADYALTARFPNGLPAIADANMSAWMKYVYMQFERPTDATGVLVSISVVDANGNYRSIGTTTSDSDGFFSLAWTPDIEGKYTVYASFDGSKSYWPSHAVSAFNVDPVAPTPAPTQAIQLQSVADTYLLPGIVAIIVAIAIGFAITIIVLKKRP
jgi:outer membrane protein assembly factor BamB